MGARADIDVELNEVLRLHPVIATTDYRISLGASAARAFLADLYHEGHLVPPDPDGRGRQAELPKRYRGFFIDTTEEFDGWSIDRTKA